MQKIFITGALLSSLFIFSQVGINIETPRSILDVSVKRKTDGTIDGNNQIYGLQAPRLTRLELTNNTATYAADQKGALIYITDISAGTATGQREYITSVGYYYFDSDANKWLKVTTGTAGATYTASNGLTMSSNNIKLGGSLNEPTTISAVTSTNKLAITGTGIDAVNIASNTISVDASNNRVGIGTATPGAKLEINNGTTNGAIKIVDGTQGASKVLTSDANGVGTWSTLPTEVDGVIGNEVTNATTNGGLSRSGSGTATSPYTLGLTSGNTTGQVMKWDGTKWAPGTDTNTNYTASNGLTMSGNNVKLGGALTEPTIISSVTAVNKLSVTGTGVDAINFASNTFSIDANNGRVGIGTATPGVKLEISAGTARAVRILNGGDLSFTADNDNNRGVDLYCGTGNTSFSFVGYGTGASSAVINLTTGAVTGNSDIRLKDNVKNITKTTDRLMKLRPVTYSYKIDTSTIIPGLIAQEVDEIFPDVVVRPKTDKEYYSIYYQYFTPYLIKGFQEQQTEIEKLKSEHTNQVGQSAEISELKAIVKALQVEIEKIKNK